MVTQVLRRMGWGPRPVRLPQRGTGLTVSLPCAGVLHTQAVKDAECLLAIVDASYKAEEALAMIQPGDDWSGPPMAVVRAHGGPAAGWWEKPAVCSAAEAIL